MTAPRSVRVGANRFPRSSKARAVICAGDAQVRYASAALRGGLVGAGPRHPMYEGRSASPAKRQRLFWIGGAAVVAALLAAAWMSWVHASYPSDREPRGAYVRIVESVTRNRPEDFFAYLEDAAQHACFTIRDYRKAALGRVRASFPGERAARVRAALRSDRGCSRRSRGIGLLCAKAKAGSQARSRLARAAAVEIQGERAARRHGAGHSLQLPTPCGWDLGAHGLSPKLTSEARRAQRAIWS